MEPIAWHDPPADGAKPRLLEHLAEAGYPVPAVGSGRDGDVVTERVAGPTIDDELTREPRQVERYGRLLGELHERLHRLPAPDWLSAVDAGARVSDAAFHTASTGAASGVILHLDLHPGTVVLSGRGPVVVGWRVAAAGDAGLDAACSILAMLGPATRSGLDERVAALRVPLVEAYLAACGVDPRPWLAAAAGVRERTVTAHAPAMADAEREWLEQNATTCLDELRF